MTNTIWKQYLEPTFFFDFESREVTEFAAKACATCNTQVEKAVALYYAVRDEIRYDPFNIQFARTAFKASSILEKKVGHCVAKAVLLAALGRQQGIPCRLGFADVTNHLSTARLREMMGTDLFVYHGYTDMYLQDKWVKTTPAFNLSLCTKFNVTPLEFDGIEDSIFHESNTLGQKHMEYVNDRGHYADLPFEEIFTSMHQTYPTLFENVDELEWHDFEADAENEAKR